MTTTRLQHSAKSPAFPGVTLIPRGVLQRKCACGGSAGLSGECEGCSRQSLSIQRSTENSELGTQDSNRVPPIVNEVLRSPGQPLDATTRAFMEPQFGHDFSRVRVHNDAHAAESARAIGAVAYTMGQDIVFRPDQYQPQTNEGRHLLAHELTHVVQQGDRGTQVDAGGPTILENAALQREADNWADRVTRSSLPQGTTAQIPAAVPGSAPLSVQLQDDPESAKKTPEAEVLPDETPLGLATALVAKSATTVKERADWILKAADQGFVTFETKKARENLENMRDEKQVESLDPKAADYDVPILAVEVVLAKQVVKRWVDAKGVGDKGSIRFGSMIRPGTEGHGKGKAIDINNLKMITSVTATIAVLNDLDKDVHSSYGLGMPFQGDFFDPADELETKQEKVTSTASAAPETKSDTPPAAADAGAKSTEKKETPTTATVSDALRRFKSNVYQSTGTKGADNKWSWKDSIQEAGGAYKKLKSQALKDTLASRRKEGFSLIIFPDNDNHLHVELK